MSFLYAIPGEDNNSFDLKKVGLEYAFEKGPQRGLLHDVFGASNCVLLTDGSVSPARARYVPEEQTWVQYGDFWIGYWTSSPPVAEELSRKNQLTGDSIRLKGQDWVIPKAVTFQATPDGIRFEYMLSRYIIHNADGELVMGEVEEQFEPLLDVAMKVYQFDDCTFDSDDEYFRCAPLVMGYNYRMGVPEMSALRLLTNDSVRSIAKSCADADSYEVLIDEELKKKASEDLITKGGETDSIAPTCQLQPIS